MNNPFQVRVLYCNINNFGDQLNKLIFKKYLHKLVRPVNSLKKAQILGIGSIFEWVMAEKNEEDYIDKEIKVFSSGFHYPVGKHYWRPDLITPDKPKRKINLYAVRGKISLARCANLCDTSNVVIGDGGLLCSELLNSAKIKKKYSLGIVSHKSESNNPIFQQIHDKVPESVIIDISQKPIDFLKQIVQCRCLISTAMHPLIACDSFGIPNLWITINDKNLEIPYYKFFDYYSVYDMEIKPFLISNRVNFSEIIDIVNSNYCISFTRVEEIKSGLKNAILRLKRDINSEILTNCRF